MTKRKTTRIDMHVHTGGSDGIGSPEQIAECALRSGIDGLAITDHHFTYTPEGLAVAEACREVGLLVFHGCEYSTNDGHILVYGVSVEELNLGYYPSMQSVIDKAHRAGGIAIPSHPFYGYKKLLGSKLRSLKRVAAVETANGQRAVSTPNVNRKAVVEAHRLSLGKIGGSDAHVPEYLGVCYTEFRGNIQTTKDFLDALRSGKHRAITQHARVADLQANHWTRFLQPLDITMTSRHFGVDDDSSISLPGYIVH